VGGLKLSSEERLPLVLSPVIRHGACVTTASARTRLYRQEVWTGLTAVIGIREYTGVLSLICDVRALPQQRTDDVASVVRGLMPGADVEVECTAAANASPADPQWVALLRDVLSQALGRDTEVVPTISGGFTDSRFVRDLGVPAYGFAPLNPESDPARRRAHGPNESVTIDDLVLETAVYLGLAHRLAAG
jgi:acetylornithine deacetylase/succinyl-diaminopimelate desuccinylase-like protein